LLSNRLIDGFDHRLSKLGQQALDRIGQAFPKSKFVDADTEEDGGRVRGRRVGGPGSEGLPAIGDEP